jgi:SAM-dependent methyltransferase
MFRNADLRWRHREPEWMDQPGLDAGLHRTALRTLERLNWLSGSGRNLWGEIAPLARARGDGDPLRVLDLATGSGDVPRDLAHRAARARIALHIDGCDISVTAIDEASKSRDAANHGARPPRYFELDVLRDPLPPDYDVVMCSLFLHHLDEEQACALLASMARAARQLVLVQDLDRSRGAMRLAYIATRLLTRSPVARVDGPLSVAAAFTRSEAAALAERAGLAGARIRACFPFRWMLSAPRA